MALVALTTAGWALLVPLRPWLLIRSDAAPLPTALLSNTFVAAPGSILNLVIFAVIAGFLFQDRVRAWWHTKRVELVLAVVGVAVALHLVGVLLGVKDLGYGLGTSLLVLAWFGTAVERTWGEQRLLLFSLWIVLATNAMGGLLWWAWPAASAPAVSGGTGAPPWGTHALADALLTAWCLMFGRARLAFLNIEARKLVWVLVAINLLNFLFVGRLSGLMGLAGIWVTWLLISGTWRPSVLLDRFRLWRLERLHARRKSKLKVIDGGRTLHRATP